MMIRNASQNGIKLTSQELETVVAGIVNWLSIKYYDENIRADFGTRSTKHATRFVLRARSSKGAGARRAASGQRTVACSWDVHYQVMELLFRQYPDTTLISALARYDGLGDFHAKASATAHRNAGSIMNPVEFGSL